MSVEQVPVAGMSTTLWALSARGLPRWAVDLPDARVASNQPGEGGSRFSVVELPPWEEFRRRIAAHPVRGMDARGFHTTRTIDYVYVLRGPLFLDLEVESVELQAGDVVVQQATAHAWRNPGQDPVSFLVVLTTYPLDP